MDYQNLFNEEYINHQYYEDMKRQQFYLEQEQEFIKMLKALNDFMESADKIAPQYQQHAFDTCILAICEKLFGNNK